MQRYIYLYSVYIIIPNEVNMMVDNNIEKTLYARTVRALFKLTPKNRVCVELYSWFCDVLSRSIIFVRGIYIYNISRAVCKV
jgi:hypothetical protein